MPRCSFPRSRRKPSRSRAGSWVPLLDPGERQFPGEPCEPSPDARHRASRLPRSLPRHHPQHRPRHSPRSQIEAPRVSERLTILDYRWRMAIARSKVTTQGQISVHQLTIQDPDVVEALSGTCARSRRSAFLAALFSRSLARLGIFLSAASTAASPSWRESRGCEGSSSSPADGLRAHRSWRSPAPLAGLG